MAAVFVPDLLAAELEPELFVVVVAVEEDNIEGFRNRCC